MGQRANLIIRQGGNTEVYYTHHRANTLDHDLFWGPTYALAFIRTQQPSAIDELLDEVWAEGGAVLDLDAKTLLWFGGEDLMYDVPLRRLHQQLMSRLWPGWRIEWAQNGMVSIAEHIVVPIERVLSEKAYPETEDVSFELATVQRHSFFRDVLSVRGERGELRFFFFVTRVPELLLAGDALLARAELRSGVPELHLTDASSFPSCGCHIDLSARLVHYWDAHPGRGTHLATKAAGRWQGWTIQWHEDRFESQLERTDGRLSFKVRTPEDLIVDLKSILLRPDDGKSGAESMVEIAEHLLKESDIRSIELNPWALKDSRLVIPLEIRSRLLEAALRHRS